jgi:hypothetical protein
LLQKTTGCLQHAYTGGVTWGNVEIAVALLAAQTPFCREGNCQEKSGMKFLIGMLLGLTAVLAQPAAARSWHDFGGGHFNVQAQQRQHPGGMQRPPPQRDFRQPDRQPDRRRDGRLTDEERRNLHRDLDRANREIYKGR